MQVFSTKIRLFRLEEQNSFYRPRSLRSSLIASCTLLYCAPSNFLTINSRERIKQKRRLLDAFEVIPGIENSNQIIDELTTLNSNWHQ